MPAAVVALRPRLVGPQSGAACLELTLGAMMVKSGAGAQGDGSNAERPRSPWSGSNGRPGANAGGRATGAAGGGGGGVGRAISAPPDTFGTAGAGDEMGLDGSGGLGCERCSDDADRAGPAARGSQAIYRLPPDSSAIRAALCSAHVALQHTQATRGCPAGGGRTPRKEARQPGIHRGSSRIGACHLCQARADGRAQLLLGAAPGPIARGAPRQVHPRLAPQSQYIL